ncbi:MAG: hemolysin family protein [Candidatus Brocadiia bacterium]
MPAGIPHLYFRLAVLAVTFCLSGFFSGSETALFSLPPDELGRMRDGSTLDRMAAALRDRPKRLLTTVLFGNMLVNVVFFSVSYLIAADLEPRVGRSGTFVLGLCSLLAIILGGEVVPKNVAVMVQRPFSRLSAVPLLVLQKLLVVVVVPLEKLADWAASLVAGGRPAVRTEELSLMADLAGREGVLDAGTGQMIAEVIELGEVRLSELMIPRVEMVSFNLESPREQLIALFRGSKLTMIPVYEGAMDDMRGVVHIKDVLFGSGERPLREAVRPVPFLPETATVEEALHRCREEGSKTAFVVDEYGSVAGLITLEDLLEEIVGEIADEYDDEQRPDVEVLADGRLRVRGGLSLREWCELLEMPMPELDVDTVGGLVMAELDRIPQVGDRAEWEGMELTVEAVRGRRAERLLVSLDGTRAGEGADA